MPVLGIACLIYRYYHYRYIISGLHKKSASISALAHFSSFADDMLQLCLKAIFYLPLEIFPEKKPSFHRHIAMIAVFLWERDGARVHIEIGFMHSALGHMGMACLLYTSVSGYMPPLLISQYRDCCKALLIPLPAYP